MKALVTGASGFTGSYMVKNLLEHGYDVRVLVRAKSNITELKQLPVEFSFGDITHSQEVDAAVKGVNKIFHIAALYRAANVSDQAYRDVNVTGTKHVLQAALKHNVERVVHCSTCGVHGHIKQPPADENAPLDPEDIYQETKLQGEQLAMRYHKEFDLPVTVVRPVGIYGPGDTRMLKLYKNLQQQRFIMFGGGDVFYHLTFVTDTVEGFRLAGEASQAVGQTYIIAGERYTTLAHYAELVANELQAQPPRWKPPVWPVEIAAHVCERVCLPLKIQPPIFPRRVHVFTHDRAFDISKAKRELGFSPQIDMPQGIHYTADWYIQQGLLKPRKRS